MHTKYTLKDAQTFKITIKKCLDNFEFTASVPAMFEIEGRDDDFKNWEKLILDKINSKCDFVVFILPGQKGKGKCYSEIKSLLIRKIPCPNQVIIASTISKGKNLISICNKILIQMNAKMGGIPWSMSNMPFADKPTMIVGLSQAKFKGGKSVFAIAATVNNKLNKYFSRSQVSNSNGAGDCL